MARSLTVSNASPLIALYQIQHLDLLPKLFERILIPPAVAREVAPTVALPGWIEVKPLREPIGARILSASLGPGESEVLSLALEAEASRVILDERPARRLAQAFDLSVVGTLGLLSAAKRKHLIPAVKPLLDVLLQQDFRVSVALYEWALVDAGEQP